jgi:hypothetical protein
MFELRGGPLMTALPTDATPDDVAAERRRRGLAFALVVAATPGEPPAVYGDAARPRGPLPAALLCEGVLACLARAQDVGAAERAVLARQVREVTPRSWVWVASWP